MKQGAAGDGLAGWLLGLPHVGAGHGRGDLEVAQRVDMVYGPLVDAQEFPEGRRRHVGGRRGLVAGGRGEAPDHPPAHASCWSRWAIAP